MTRALLLALTGLALVWITLAGPAIVGLAGTVFNNWDNVHRV